MLNPGYVVTEAPTPAALPFFRIQLFFNYFHKTSLRIPGGKVNISIPIMAIMPPGNFPRIVTGKTSLSTV